MISYIVTDFGDKIPAPYIHTPYEEKWRYYWTAEDYAKYDPQNRLPRDWCDMRNSPQVWWRNEWSGVISRDLAS